MKKGLKIVLIILGIFVLLVLTFLVVNYVRVQKQEKSQFSVNTTAYENLKEDETLENSNMAANMRAVVVKVNDKSLTVMGIENTEELFNIGFAEEGNIGFAQGQEILIYFDGMIMETYPAQLGKIGKIEMVKENSNVQIPDNILRYCYSSRDNVDVTVSELTNSGITLTIADTNELPYEYSHSYKIYKKVKNKDYTGMGYKIGEDTENSTSGYTRNRFGIYMGRSR